MANIAGICVLVAQTIFWAGLLICVRLIPQYVSGRNEGGVSNYGYDRRTLLPYSVAFLGYVIFVALAASQFPDNVRHHQLLALLLFGVALLYLLALVTSYWYQQNQWLRRTHFLIAIMTMTYQAAFSVLLVGLVSRTPSGFVFLAVQGVGDVVCLLSLLNVVQRLFVGQVVTSFGAFLLLFATTR